MCKHAGMMCAAGAKAFSTLAAGAAVLLAPDALAGTITSLGSDPVLGTFTTQFSNNQVSNDGGVAGFYIKSGVTKAAYRSPTGTATLLGTLPSATGSKVSVARVISADGSIMAGNAVGKSPSNATANRAVSWSAANGAITELVGNPATVGNADATGISDDGSTIVGWMYNSATATIQATRWTNAGGRQILGSLESGKSARAYGASADGSTVVGYGGTSAGDRAFRWTATGGMTQLSILNGGTSATCGGISGDGSTAFGYCQVGSNYRAVVWDGAGTISDLGTLAGGSSAFINACTADGSTIFGDSNYAAGSSYKGFVWTVATGMVTLDTYLTNSGVDLTGWTDLSGPACSPNGKYVVGWGTYNGVSQCFLASVPAPGAAALLGAAGLLGRRRRA